MKKLLLAIVFAVIAVAEPRPSEQDIQAIYEKNKDSQFIYKDHIAISLTKDKAAVIYDKTKKLDKADYVKFDPYLGLYLIKSDLTLRAAFMIDELNAKESMWVNILEQNATAMGHIAKFGSNLGELDELSYDANNTGLLVCDCGSMVGIGVGGNKFVGNRYLRNFVKYDDVHYGDIGVSFEDNNSTLSVKSANPFGVGNMLLAGDIVIKLNDKTPKSLRELNEAVLFADKNATLSFEVLRNGKLEKFDVKLADLAVANPPEQTKAQSTQKPKPKKVVVKPFLPSYGLSLNRNLIIQKVSPNSKAKRAGLQRGDKILAIDKVPVRSVADIEKIMRSTDRSKFYYLISRDDFQFFVRVYK
ncbi:putative protein (PDZ domain) [Campylobacter iguaniorum]|uniref:DUF7488 domain-containing protein n=1 Tax=Campylobacter iguaniorum TaxID=1244531 RepID=UPI00073A0AA0|nr:PDZ domain-containing protein [Campylobacter iguaniorum]ALV23731.1 putative protein (PDZ domain) [Campylobacter iguaniorum]